MDVAAVGKEDDLFCGFVGWPAAELTACCGLTAEGGAAAGEGWLAERLGAILFMSG